MKNRITLKTPGYSHCFDIRNGSAKYPFTWWEFYPTWESRCQLRDVSEDLPAHPKLDEVLRLVGSHATLWIDRWKGTIAPMDNLPQGWTYPSGRELEPEWWWQWHPDPYSEGEAVKTLNSDPIEAWQSKTPFKSGIPFQMQRSMGEVQAIEAIPVQRLPHLIKKDAVWVFEFDS